MKRLLAGSIGVLLLALALPAFAGAATKYDLSYQNGGLLQLPQLRNSYGQVAQSCSVTGKRLSIAGRFGTNAPTPSTWQKHQKLGFTSVSLHTRQKMTLGVADVRWHMQRIPTNNVVDAEAFAPDGSFIYAVHPDIRGQRDRARIFRVNADGRRTKGFGRKGYVSLRIDAIERVIALQGGKLFVIGSHAKKQLIVRLTKTGKLDPTWSDDGKLELDQPQSVLPLRTADSATPTPAGGLILNAQLGLLKLTAAGNVDTGWANNGHWSPPAVSGPATNGKTYTLPTRTLRTTVLKGGNLSVLYADGVEGDTSVLFDLKLAYVDMTSGVTTLFNDRAGTFNYGGDTGFADARPWILAPSSGGPILAQAETVYGNPGGTFNGAATRFTLDALQPASSEKISNRGFAIDAFAVDPAAKYLYACGSFGATSSKAKDPAKRAQRKSVAIKRIAL